MTHPHLFKSLITVCSLWVAGAAVIAAAEEEEKKDEAEDAIKRVNTFTSSLSALAHQVWRDTVAGIMCWQSHEKTKEREGERLCKVYKICLYFQHLMYCLKPLPHSSIPTFC